MEETKYIRVKYNGYAWNFPAYLIAKDRSQYYVRNDKETTYAAEYEFIMNDDYELIDWFQNNMNWEDVSKFAKLEEQPFELMPTISESELEVYIKD